MAGGALGYLNAATVDLNSVACGEAIEDWTRKLPAQARDETGRILIEAAAAGASTDDLAMIAACAIEAWRAQQPDADGPDPSDRHCCQAQRILAPREKFTTQNYLSARAS